jgi:excisionase family DNA binding protein
LGGIYTAYITVREAAAKWNISERLVQKYCAQGRIEGAKKSGTSWRIPDTAEKPQDPRKTTAQPAVSGIDSPRTLFSDLMPLMNSAFEPGHCLEYIDRMEDGGKKNIALAEYYYFSGQPEKAARKAKRFLQTSDTASRLSACLIYAYANLSIGKIEEARAALNQIKQTLSKDSPSPYLQAMEAFITATACVLLHLPLPENLPPVDRYLRLLPPGILSFAFYVQAHYLYLLGSYEKSIGIVETALMMRQKEYPIPAIYLHLVAVMDYMSLKQTPLAKKHLLRAWELAQPDDLIEGFGEHHGLLGGMLEAVIKPNWPEDFKRIIAITYRFSSG